MNFFIRLKNGFLDSLFPKHIKCIFCGEELAQLNPFDSCDKCKDSLPYLDKNFCPRCGGKIEDDQKGVCFNCKKNNFDFSIARAVCSYTNQIIPLVYRFKFGSGKYLAEPIAQYMYAKLQELAWDIDLITYVPMFKKREKQRGFNQAHELAVEIGKLANLPVSTVFEKLVDTHEQARLDSKSRRKNLKDAFKVINHDIKNKKLLIIDDIFTTGATTHELAHLVKDKCNSIYVLTFAHTILNEKDI